MDSDSPASNRPARLPWPERVASAVLMIAACGRVRPAALANFSRRCKSVRLRRGSSADMVFSNGFRLTGIRLHSPCSAKNRTTSSWLANSPRSASATLDKPDPEISAAWADEAKDRLTAYRRGELAAVDESEVFGDLDRA